MGLSYASSTELHVLAIPNHRLRSQPGPKIVSSPMSVVQPAAQTTAGQRPLILNLIEVLPRSSQRHCKTPQGVCQKQKSARGFFVSGCEGHLKVCPTATNFYLRMMRQTVWAQ